MSINLFSFDDYKRYLVRFSASLPKKGYGFRSRMAEAAGCQTAYIAQVLHSHAQLSLEQAEALNPLLQHSERESEYFLLLVQLARASTPALRRRLESRQERLRAEQLNLKTRFEASTELGERELYGFFSRWYVNAVQLAAGIPRLGKRERLRAALGMSEELFQEALDFLFRSGLLRETGGRLEPGQTRIFIGKDSPILKTHHANWRQKAVQSLDLPAREDLHFTSLYTLSSRDVALIREELVKQIERIRATVKNSPEEELHCFSLDFFRVDR